MPPFDDEFELIADERCSDFCGNSLTRQSVSSNADPFGAFFDYAADYWSYHLVSVISAPVDFNLDDVLELASPTSTRHRAWALQSYSYHLYDEQASSGVYATLKMFVRFGNVSMMNQLLDRSAPNSDGDRRSIVDAATKAIGLMNLGHFRALMNHQNTAVAVQSVEMLKILIKNWVYLGSDHRKEWLAKLIADLFDTLPSDSIPAPKSLLRDARMDRCMPAIEKIFERAKADPTFQEQLMQPIIGTGPLTHRNFAVVVETVEMLKIFMKNWVYLGSADRKEWLAKLIADLFDTLPSESIPAPKYLLRDARMDRCMPAIEKLFERAKADPTFKEQLMEPIIGTSLLGQVARRGHFEILRYLRQQDGIEAHE